VDNKEYFEGCIHLETRGVILFFLRWMLDEEAFNGWCLLNWEAKGIFLNSHYGLGLKYVFLLFNFGVATHHVLQLCTWNIVGILAYVQS
jgi:hypothetical protein